MYHTWQFIRNDGEPPVYAKFTDDEIRAYEKQYPEVRWNW